VKKNSFGREPPFRKALSEEADESPPLGAVTREQLVKHRRLKDP
jgi:hypothetical protein